MWTAPTTRSHTQNANSEINTWEATVRAKKCMGWRGKLGIPQGVSGLSIGYSLSHRILAERRTIRQTSTHTTRGIGIKKKTGWLMCFLCDQPPSAHIHSNAKVCVCLNLDASMQLRYTQAQILSLQYYHHMAKRLKWNERFVYINCSFRWCSLWMATDQKLTRNWNWPMWNTV